MKKQDAKQLINRIYGNGDMSAVSPIDSILVIWNAKIIYQQLINTGLRYFDTDSLKGEKK